MRLSQEQYDALTPYAQHFETMARAKWARNPGSAALDIMHGIYVQVTGDRQRFNKGCSHCIMRLLTDLGRIYLADREERQKVAVKESLTTERRVIIKGEDIAAEMEAIAKRPRRTRTKKAEI